MDRVANPIPGGPPVGSGLQSAREGRGVRRTWNHGTRARRETRTKRRAGAPGQPEWAWWLARTGRLQSPRKTSRHSSRVTKVMNVGHASRVRPCVRETWFQPPLPCRSPLSPPVAFGARPGAGGASGLATYSFTRFFVTVTLRRRPYLTHEACIRVVERPDRVLEQADGRVRFWAIVTEYGGRALRVVTLNDRQTIHNAFFDRGFRR